MFVLSFFEFEARFLKTEFCFLSKCLSVRFISKMHFDVFQNVCPFVFLQTAFAFFFEKFVHSFFLKSLSFSLFFYQIFSSQIISKTCRRTKGKCPFVFWIHSSISQNWILLFFDCFAKCLSVRFSPNCICFFLKKLSIRFFLKSLSFSLFFCRIFSSQIISKTRKTCRRTKGNLLPLGLLLESSQVFGIAR